MHTLPSLLLLLLASATADLHPAALVGDYDGGQMELAAGLRLSADGQFEYGLSYGALDERATGRWYAEGNRVVLDGDPVKPPRFTLIGQRDAPAGTILIGLEAPAGMNQQYFHGVALFADGTAADRQLPVEGDLALPADGGKAPVIVRMALPMLDLVSAPVAVDVSKGLAFRFRFEPNDLGRVDFRGTVLDLDGGQLVLSRHGRAIRFRRVGDSPQR